MKNVLEKTGHKKAYYSRRRFAKFSAATFALLLIAAIPVGISYKISLMNIDNASSKKEEKQNQGDETLIMEYENK